VKVQISDADGCTRFIALAVKDVSVVPSPAWMQKRLTAAGMRPINLVVDATNYAMLEYAQPIHAYDERHIAGNRIEVRGARDGETLKTLDGQVRQLAAGDLLITDGSGPIGLAGIMGGESSEVRDDTTGVIIEVAAFAPTRIRRTAKRLGLHTEASHRFERGVDVDNLPTVAWRVADLLAAGAAAAKTKAPRAAAEHLDTYPADVQKRVVAVRVSHAKSFLALPGLNREQVIDTLKRLDFDLLDSTDDRLVFEVPYFRPDVEREADLVEEVGRIAGFDRIPYQLPVMNIRPNSEDPFLDFQEAARIALAATGLRETVSFPFVGEAEVAALGLPADHPLRPSLSLANPLSEAHRWLQTSLAPALLRAAAGNRRHGDRGARLFECGRGYFNTATLKQRCSSYPELSALARPGRHLSRKAKGEGERPTERHWIGGVLDQPFAEKGWNAPEEQASFYHGKGAVLGCLRALGVTSDVQLVRIDPRLYPYLHPGAAAAVTIHGRPAGVVGELHPRAAAALELDQGGAPVLFELDLEAIFDAKGRGARAAGEPARFPAVTRDLALLVDATVTHADIEAAVGKFKRKQHLARFSLFDVYAGENLPAGKKSLAYAFAFQAPDRTLTDAEVEAEIAALLGWLGETVKATQR
jgi:phenylalanyl-tRNA synthetase beta chain